MVRVRCQILRARSIWIVQFGDRKRQRTKSTTVCAKMDDMCFVFFPPVPEIGVGFFLGAHPQVVSPDVLQPDSQLRQRLRAIPTGSVHVHVTVMQQHAAAISFEWRDGSTAILPPATPMTPSPIADRRTLLETRDPAGSLALPAPGSQRLQRARKSIAQLRESLRRPTASDLMEMQPLARAADRDD
jgi:hypothetical protein